jgi:hypothetical protein
LTAEVRTLTRQSRPANGNPCRCESPRAT